MLGLGSLYTDCLPMNLSDYPLFVPPETLAKKGRENWSGDEANQYRDWLIGVLPNRVNELTNRLEEPLGSPPPEHLLRLGTKISQILGNAPFSEGGPVGRRLTNQGYAIAADVGLLVADYLLKEHAGKLRWEIMKKPKELSYNLPVLQGFSGNYLDPVGGSTAEAAAVLRGKRGPDTWKRIYEFWVAKV